MPSSARLLSIDPTAGVMLSADPNAADSTPSTSGSLVARSVAGAVPAAANLAAEIATNPNLPAATASVGRVVAPIASVVGGAMSGEPIAGVMGAAKASWLGGKTGWFSGKLLQNFAAPVASALEKLAPYAQAISTLSGVQSGLNLAQLADQNRRDIGIMGVGSSVKPSALSPNEQAATISSIHGLLEKGVPMGHPVIQGLLMKLPQDVIQAIGHEAQAQKAQAQP